MGHKSQDAETAKNMLKSLFDIKRELKNTVLD